MAVKENVPVDIWEKDSCTQKKQHKIVCVSVHTLETPSIKNTAMKRIKAEKEKARERKGKEKGKPF